MGSPPTSRAHRLTPNLTGSPLTSWAHPQPQGLTPNLTGSPLTSWAHLQLHGLTGSPPTSRAHSQPHGLTPNLQVSSSWQRCLKVAEIPGWGLCSVVATSEHSSVVSYNTGHSCDIQAQLSSQRCLPKRRESIYPHKTWVINAHSTFICINLRLETTQTCISWKWTHQLWSLHPHGGVQLRTHSTDESQHSYAA